MTIRYRIACAYFVLIAVILGFGAALAYLLFRIAFSRLTPLLLVLLFTASCAPKPLPVIPTVPLEEIHIGDNVGPHVLLCLESPDDMPSRHRWVCIRMDAVRRYFAHAQAAE